MSSLVVLAARDSTAAARNDADIVCDYKTDVTALAKAVARDDDEIVLRLGTYNANGGTAADGKRYLRVGTKTTVRAEPGAVLLAENDVCRITLDEPGASLLGITTKGWIGIQGSASDLTVDGCTIVQSLQPGKHLDFGGRGGCTSALQFWGDPYGTMRRLTVRNSRIEDSYHHGIGWHLNGKQEGQGTGLGTFADVTVENVDLVNCGSGYIKAGVEDWSCATDCDTGNVLRWLMRNIRIYRPWQTGIHFDGSWKGHLQTVRELLVEDCLIVEAGQRSNTVPKERYQSGVYAQSGVFRRIRTERCYNCGGLLGNEEADSLVIEDWIDDGSTIGLAVEYGGHGAKIQAELRNNVKRAYIGVGDDQVLDLTLVYPPKNPVLLGQMTKRIYAEAPQHAGDLARYLSLPYDMRNTRITFRTDLAPGLIWTKPDTARLDPAKITVLPLGDVVEEPEQPTIPPAVVVPQVPENALGVFVYGPYNTIRLAVPSLGRDVPVVADVPEDLKRYFSDGVYVKGGA